MSTDENTLLVRRYYDEVANCGDVAPDDVLAALLARGLAFYPPNATTAQEGLARHVAAERGTVVVRFTVRATQRGTLLGIPPTGKPFSVQGVDLFRITNGKLAELRRYFDALTIAQQLRATLMAAAPA